MFQGPKHVFLVVISTVALVTSPQRTWAEDDLDLAQIEAEMNRRGEKEAAETAARPDNDQSSSKPTVKLKDLYQLTSFSDVAVIQKKSMPKSNRFQLFGGVDLLTNNPFFDSYGFNGALSFFLNETWGLEFMIMKHSVNARTVTSDLESKGVSAKTMLSSLSFTGGSLIFVPFYGKVTLLDRLIIPFDFYFSVGGGVTETSYVDKSATSIHLGLGQIFSLGQSFAWRWDLSQIQYTAAVPDNNGTNAGGKADMSDLYLGIGLSYFFPGVSYR